MDALQTGEGVLDMMIAVSKQSYHFTNQRAVVHRLTVEELTFSHP